MELKLTKRLGETLKAQILEANALYAPATAKANANKLWMDAIVEDAGFDLKEVGSYRLHETKTGDLFLVSADKGD